MINVYKYLKGIYTEEAEILQCEPYQVVGLGAKGWNQKRKKINPNPKKLHKAKIQLKARGTKWK